MEKRDLDVLKQRFIDSREFEIENASDVYEECFLIINNQIEKELFPILFYALIDEAKTQDYSQSMSQVICNFINSTDEEWVIDEVINAVEIAYPHAKINYAIILNFTIAVNFKRVKKIVIDSNNDIKSKIVEILDLIIIEDEEYGLIDSSAQYLKKAVLNQQ